MFYGNDFKVTVLCHTYSAYFLGRLGRKIQKHEAHLSLLQSVIHK